MSNIEGLVFPEDGQELYQQDFQNEQDAISKELLSRERDFLSAGVISGFELTIVDNNPVIETGVGRDAVGRRLCLTTAKTLSIPDDGQTYTVIVRHAWVNENYVLDGTVEEKSIRRNFAEVVFVAQQSEPLDNELLLYDVVKNAGVLSVTDRRSGVDFATKGGVKANGGTFDAVDAVVALKSQADGAWGSIVQLQECDGDDYKNRWDIARQSNGGNKALYLRYFEGNEIAAEFKFGVDGKANSKVFEGWGTVPPMAIIAILPGYFSGANNGNFHSLYSTYALPSDYVWCNGGLYEHAEAPYYPIGAGRYRPKIDNDRFLMGVTSASIGSIGGTNSANHSHVTNTKLTTQISITLSHEHVVDGHDHALGGNSQAGIIPEESGDRIFIRYWNDPTDFTETYEFYYDLAHTSRSYSSTRANSVRVFGDTDNRSPGTNHQLSNYSYNPSHNHSTTSQSGGTDNKPAYIGVMYAQRVKW